MQVDSFTDGGMEQVVIDMMLNLDSRCCQTTMLVLGEHGSAVSDARRRGIRLLTLPASNRKEAYRNLLVEEKVDVVNAHFSLFGAPAAAELGIPFIQTIHGAYVCITPDHRAAYQCNDRFTSAYACVSQAAAHYSDVNLGLSVSKMVVIPNGINTRRLNKVKNADQRDRLRRKMALRPENYAFLNVGSIQAPKGQILLVQAFAEVYAEHPEARLILLGKAGDPRYLSKLKRSIIGHGLEKVVILPGYHDEVELFYCMADAFVLPSLWEGWSLALAEAICADLPVAATAVGSAPDLLPEVGGYLIPPPFESITDVGYDTLTKYLTKDDPQFIRNLAKAMKEMYVERPRPILSDSLRRAMDCKTAYSAYEQLYLWLVQGGDPSAARAWSGPFSHLWTEPIHFHQRAA
jgi:glycosyltransferase involved in cell wall biosynthesis